MLLLNMNNHIVLGGRRLGVITNRLKDCQPLLQPRCPFHRPSVNRCYKAQNEDGQRLVQHRRRLCVGVERLEDVLCADQADDSEASWFCYLENRVMAGMKEGGQNWIRACVCACMYGDVRMFICCRCRWTSSEARLVMAAAERRVESYARDAENEER